MARENAQHRRVREVLAKMEPEIRKAFVEAMAKVTSAVDRKALIAALNAGNIEQAVDLLRINQALLTPLFEAMRSGFIVGGTLVAADLPKGLSGSFGFNGRHIRAEGWVTQHVGGFIQGIETDTLAMTRTIIREGIENGTSSAKLAREITGRVVGRTRVGGYMGLTSQQTDSIIRGRSDLLSGDPKRMKRYMKLKQRDKRFDAQIKQAIKSGKSIKGSTLDRIMEAHKSKALAYRGKVIARNEAHTSLAAGREEGYQQLLDNPEIESVSVRWQHNLSIEPREDHVAMSGTVIHLGETFDFSDASMKHPHDPAGGPKHSVACRCIAVYRAKRKRD